VLRNFLYAVPFLSLAVLFTSPAQAEIKPILTAGLELGGEDLVTTSKSDLTAGGGISLGAGLSFSATDSSLSLRALIYYLFDTVEFTSPDGEASSDAFPIELGLFNSWDKHEIGAGLSYHLNPSHELEFSNIASGTVDFEDASGLFLQYNYIFSQTGSSSNGNNTYVGIKYTAMDYEVDNFIFDASSFGIYLGTRF